MQEQSFFHDGLQMYLYGQDWVGFDQNRKYVSHEALVVTLEKKKKKDFLPFLYTLYPFSRLFLGLENCWANFKTFFQEF